MVAKFGFNSVWDPKEAHDGLGTGTQKSILKHKEDF